MYLLVQGGLVHVSCSTVQFYTLKNTLTKKYDSVGYSDYSSDNEEKEELKANTRKALSKTLSKCRYLPVVFC